MNLEGEIWELELIPRLVELGSQTFTGALRFENDSVIKIVYFKEGNILSASTNDRADSIDEILLRSGKVTREHVKQALSKRKETETLGDALLGLGFIAKRELAWARRVQLIGILRSIDDWKAGSFTIVADYLPKREEGTVFPLPQVVLELILTDQDRSKYDQLLESGSAVFRKSASFGQSFSDMGLNQEAETITSRIDGVLSAAEVASESGSDAFNVYKLLHALNLLGLIEKTEKSLEVSGFGAAASVGGFEPPTGPTVEMALDFGAGAGSVGAVSEFGSPEPAANYDDPASLDTDSSVPREDLDSYSYEAPPAEESADLGLGYQEPVGRAAEVRASAPPPARESLGSLETLRDFEVPSAEFPPIEERIAQKQDKKKPLSAPPARRSRKTGLIAAIAVGVIALAAAGGWYYFEKLKGEEQVAQAQPAPVPVRPAPAVPATDTAAAPATSVDSASTSTSASPAPVAATAAPTTSAPPATATSAPPSKPPVAATTTRAPEPNPVQPPVTQQAPPAKPPVAASSSKYAAQAQKYVKEASTVPFTVQFELVCRDASIEKAISAGGSKIWFVPITYRGESCYRVFWGRYTTREMAERGAAEIPAALRGGKATVVSPGASNQ